MRVLHIALLPAMLISDAAIAQQLRNVTGFDHQQLVGKTCRGTLSTGGTCENCLGALRLTFSAQHGELAGQYGVKLGWAAYRDAATDIAGLEMAPVRDLRVTAGRITFAGAAGQKLDLAYSNGVLTGSTDPRGMPGRESWRVAAVKADCK